MTLQASEPAGTYRLLEGVCVSSAWEDRATLTGVADIRSSVGGTVMQRGAGVGQAEKQEESKGVRLGQARQWHSLTRTQKMRGRDLGC